MNIPVPIPVIVNAHGGAAARRGRGLANEVCRSFAEAGIAAEVSCVAPEQVAPAIQETRAPLVVVGGGDGTLGTAAGVLAASGRRLGILPLGTRNHLARDLGLPLDMAEAARVIVQGEDRRIDLGQAGERVFVNNCSIGFYPRLVHAREAAPGRLPRWLATAVATLAVLRRLRAEKFRVEWNGVEHRIHTPLLFVGNNRYSMKTGRLGRRESLSDGRLSLAAAAAPGPAGLAWTAARLAIGRADPERDFTALEELPALSILGHHVHRVALDGEQMRLRFPLRLKILAGALTVRVPAGDAMDASPAGQP